MSATDVTALLALASIALFVVGLKRLSRVRTARGGNGLMAAGMLLAVVLTLVEQGRVDYQWIVAGLVAGAAIGVAIVVRAQATRMPEIVARFNGLSGLAVALIAVSLFWSAVVESPGTQTAAGALGTTEAAMMIVSVLIGGPTFSGSVIAELKLRGTLSGTPRIPARATVMMLLLVGGIGVGALGVLVLDGPLSASVAVAGMVVASLSIGLVLVMPIGGADMPVVISLLNALSGLAAAATGFTLQNNLLIMAGTIVGAAGLILTRIMCEAMNRSLRNVLVGGYGGGVQDDSDYQHIVSADAEQAAMVLEVARSVVIVPGYGLAAARAQSAVYELATVLQQQGAQVRFAIHPVAGRMPGQMNVVLAEADVPYELLFEMDAINQDFPQTDVVIVVGANDVVNPAALTDPSGPIAGMPILEVGKAERVFVVKRSLSPGYAGIKNALFEQDNTVMLFGDAKTVLDEMAGELARATA